MTTSAEGVSGRRDLRLAQIMLFIAPCFFVSNMLVARAAADLVPPVALAELDAIYLDPMFVSRNRTARPKKELWALARLVRDEDDGASLLAAALATGCPRVVVKR